MRTPSTVYPEGINIREQYSVLTRIKKKKERVKKKRHTSCSTKPALTLFPSYADKTSLAKFATELEEGKVLLRCLCERSLQATF